MNKVLYAVISLFFQQAFGQHLVDFSIQNEVCVGEELRIQNGSNEGLTIEWDFCAAQLEGAYTTGVRGSVTAFMTDISIVSDNGLWYGFAVSRNNLLYKIYYGNSPANPPDLIESLGNPGNLLSSPEGIDVLKDGNDWYAFITNIGNDIIRVHWGNSLEMTPTAQKLNLTNYNKLNGPVQIEVVKDNDVFVAIVANVYSSTITLIRFGASLDNFPVDTDVIESVKLPNAFDIYGVAIVRECSEWIAFAISSGRIYKIDIGSELFSPISLDEISDFTNDLPIAIGSYNHIRATIEGETTYVFFTSYTGRNIAAAIWRRGASHAEYKEIDDTFTFGPYGLDIYKNQGKYGIILSGYDTGAINHISITSPCSASTRLFNETPRVISYSEPGTYTVSLQVTFSDGVVCTKTHDLIVNSKQAPSIDFSITNECVFSPIIFDALNNGDITDFNWNFGDTNTSTAQNPTHQYASPGDYLVSLLVTADNGCNNFTEKTIKIYDHPTASFTLPTGLICTNNEFALTNSTFDDYDGKLTYEWFVNDIFKSSTRDFKYAFTTEGDQQVKLKTSIPGCSDELTQTLLNVQIGPVVDFSFTGKCEDEEIVFTNSSSGSISGNQWDFNNGNTSTEVNPTEIYSSYGNYQVSLITTGTNGCESKLTKPVTIYSVPQPNFSLDLPPFSCAGSLSQFNDLTPALTDSNITAWSWSFGDAAKGTATQKNPNYTYNTAADYDVSLQVTSNFGCSSNIKKTITISPSPVAEFASGPACINKPTQFTDASGSDVKAWLWTVNNSSYTTKNPTHTFSTTGTQSVMLTVTGNNNCVSQKTKTVIVPVPVIADFASASTCAGTTAIFQEINGGGADPAVAWNWNFAGQANVSTSPAQHIFPNTGNFPVTLTSTRQSGCSYSLTKSILISQPPAASFTVSTEAGAAPLTVGFTNTSSFATSFLWKFNDLNNSTSTEFSPAFVFNLLGSYQVELIANNAAGCSDKFTETIQVVVPDINAVLSDFILSSTPDGGKKATVTIENKSNITLVNPEVYIDLAGNAVIREKLSGTILPGQSITRILTVDIIPRDLTYACAEVKVLGDSFQFDNRACLNLTSEPTYLQPYPNPAQSQLFLDWINENQESLQVVIYNSSGQIAMNRKYNLLPGLNQVQVDVNDLASGIYFVSYSDGRIIQSFRFSVAR